MDAELSTSPRPETKRGLPRDGSDKGGEGQKLASSTNVGVTGGQESSWGVSVEVSRSNNAAGGAATQMARGTWSGRESYPSDCL